MDPDPDPAIFFIVLQDANKKPILFCLLLFKVHLHHIQKYKVKKKSQSSRNQGFS
jgi:hypothetical protein